MKDNKPRERETIEIEDIDGLPDNPAAAARRIDGDAMVLCTVEKGHTVEVPTGEKIVRGHSDDGKEQFRPAIKRYGPGEQVQLPASEARWLKDLGYLVDPNRKVRTISEVNAAKESPVGLQQNNNNAVGPQIR